MKARFCVITILNIADALITLWAISVFGAIEVNPLMSAIINLSPMLFLAIKVVAATSVLVLMWKMQHKTGVRVQYIVMALFIIVVLWNILNLLPLIPYFL